MAKTRRVIKDSKKLGTVSRTDAMAAVDAVKARRTTGKSAKATSYKSAPYLVKK